MMTIGSMCFFQGKRRASAKWTSKSAYWPGDLSSDANSFEKLYATLENLRDFGLLLRKMFSFSFSSLPLSLSIYISLLLCQLI
ncbi:hypothetical protein VIGAN_05174300 [Vigna angularis var. angularis]|uniref:Uncharacterized protein n=1 Tax=Vigna angularis var. angularis TaxID=157739 RepID=A0A0S3S673_PHAAN|nr:hypothetical protein VIGAN_05174300 [Vigna angularis var. angularis]